MKLTILGSGSFVVDKDHWGPGFLIETDSGKKILVDAGCGVAIRLAQLGIDIKDIDYIFITHFHTDHINDLMNLIFNQKINILTNPDVKKNPKIFGPKGIIELTNKLHKIGRLASFINKKGPDIIEIVDKLVAEDFIVTPFEVKHYEELQSNAYRFELEGKTVTFSGDTAFCDGIIEAALDSDIFFVDSSWPKGTNRDDHLTTTLAGEVCTKANVKKAILIHLKPNGFGKDLVAEVGETYNGEVVLAKDLMEVIL